MSVLLLGVSVWIRLRLNESPVFQKMKDEGKSSKAPLTEAFGNWSNAKIVILALVGGVMGQGVVWYTGQFYALFFLQSILKVDGYTANLLIAWSLLLGTGFFVVFGALSDKIGRKPIILAGCLIAALTFFPIFRMITTNANPALEKAIESVKVEVVADPAGCGDLFNPVGTRVFTAPCDTARAFLAQSSVKYTTSYGAAGSGVKVVVNGKEVPYTEAKARNPAVLAAVQAAGYPKPGDAGIVKMSNPFDIFRPQVAAVIGLLFILVIFVTMVYGPIAAMLVELFPTRIRYTSMSLPYHIGNGWFGGLAARDRVRDRGIDRRYLRRPLVSDHLRIDHRGRRLLLPAGNQGRRYHQELMLDPAARAAAHHQQTGRGAIRGRFRFQSTRSGLPADELQHDLAPMRPRAMLDQVDRLPGSQRQRAAQHRDLQRGRGQHGLDMRRHIVGPFGVVAPSGVFGRQRGSAPSSRSSSTVGSAFSWIVSDAEVWRMNSVTAPSRAPASRTNFATSAVRSVKPAPGV